MSVSADVCVGCECPIVDQTIKGDLTLGEKYFTPVSKNLIVGSQSGCRNCAVILDAITTFAGTADWTTTRCSIGIGVYENILAIKFSGFIAVFRSTGMSD
jgi:hypothetical protein